MSEAGEVNNLPDVVRRFLAERAAMALATRGPDGLWVASLYFAGDLEALYFLSSPRSRHGRNLQADPAVAVAVNEDEHDWRSIRGVQLEGTCAQAASPREWLRGWRTYLAKFPVARDLFRGRAGSGVARKVANTRLYVVRPRRVFYLDNQLGFGQRQEVPLG